MGKNFSPIAGVAAVFVFGFGLLLVGRVSDGIGVLGIAAYALSLALSSEWSKKALFTAIAASIFGEYLAYQAAASEITGHATYWRPTTSRGGFKREPVSRDESPAKFRAATNFRWGVSVIFGLVSVGAFLFFRNREDSENFY